MIFRLILVLFVFAGCSNSEFQSKAEMLKYLQKESSGYTKVKDVNGIKILFQYRPTDLIVLQEVGRRGANSETVEKLRSKYGKYLYFNLSISKNNKELLSTIPKNRNEFGGLVNQLVFRMNENVFLFNQKKDTIALLDYVYPRMYGYSKSTSMMFVYPYDKEKINNSMLNFSIHDMGLGIGEVNFRIESDKIITQPTINFKK